MIYIAHRGNLSGPSDKENNPDHIMKALSYGFHCELDIWYIDNKFVLGHDKPQYEIDYTFLQNDRFWHHAKNIPAFFELNRMRPNYLINCFYHDRDDATLTSGGWIWTYPGKELTSDSIAVMPECVTFDYDYSMAYGICSDFVLKYSSL
jgi:hypothetical protein